MTEWTQTWRCDPKFLRCFVWGVEVCSRPFRPEIPISHSEAYYVSRSYSLDNVPQTIGFWREIGPPNYNWCDENSMIFHCNLQPVSCLNISMQHFPCIHLCKLYRTICRPPYMALSTYSVQCIPTLLNRTPVLRLRWNTQWSQCMRLREGEAGGGGGGGDSIKWMLSGTWWSFESGHIDSSETEISAVRKGRGQRKVAGLGDCELHFPIL